MKHSPIATIAALNDLIVQATRERSHYYVKKVCEEAVATIKELVSNHACEYKVGRPGIEPCELCVCQSMLIVSDAARKSRNRSNAAD